MADDPNRFKLGQLFKRYSTSYKSLRSIAQVVLGPYYEELKQFYLDILQSEGYQYIVYVARRSIGLAELFSIILWHEKKIPGIQDKLDASWAISTSDSTIMSYAAQISKELKTGPCPKILIVDDLLVQGNSMNEILYTIESNVIRELQRDGLSSDADKYWQDIVNAINIRVFAQNTKISMVNLQYQLQLKPKYRMNPKEWHDLSRRISGVIQFSGMANATFIMGAEQLAGTIEKQLLPKGIRLGSASLPPYTELSNTFHERHYFSWPDPSHPSPKYYCTLRVIKNQFTDTYLLMPFIFLPRLSERSYDLLKKQVFKKWGLDSTNAAFLCDDGHTSRLEYESMILHISESLLMCWMQASGISLSSDDYIPTKIALNYGINRSTPLMKKALFCRLTDPDYLFSWSELTKLLSDITEDSEPLSFTQAYQPEELPRIRRDLDDKLYMTKLQETKESYRCSHSLPPDHSKPVLDFSLRQNKQTNWNIFLDEFNASVFKHVPGVSTAPLFRHLLESMDFGVITLKARQDGARFAQVLRMSEQSLFLHPKRYSIYYPMLSYLEERQLRLGINLEEELRIFLTHEQSHGIISEQTDVNALTTELTQYLDNLKKSGQELSDWDIGFEKCLILDLNSALTEPKLRRLYTQERLAFLEATRIRRTLYNDCHAFYPL